MADIICDWCGKPIDRSDMSQVLMGRDENGNRTGWAHKYCAAVGTDSLDPVDSNNGHKDKKDQGR